MARIICDVDEVLRDVMTPTLAIYNKKYKENKQLEEITTGNLLDDLPKLKESYFNNEDFFRHNYKKIFMEGKPFYNSIEYLALLKQEGHTIVIATSQYKGLEKYTCDWLNNQFLMDYDELHFTKDKGKIEGDYMVDDMPHNFDRFKGQYILMDKPWNRDVFIPHRVKNWREIYSLLK